MLSLDISTLKSHINGFNTQPDSIYRETFKLYLESTHISIALICSANFRETRHLQLKMSTLGDSNKRSCVESAINKKMLHITHGR